MVSRTRAAAFAAVACLAVPLILVVCASGSDHADTPEIAASPGTDLTDVYAFQSPNDSGRVVLVMDLHPLIPGGQGLSVDFDPNVLYQFKIDTTGDSVEDRVIQLTFTGSGPTQLCHIAGPAAPERTGLTSTLLTPDSVSGQINTPFVTSNGLVDVFAGGREDPFFFDLARFFEILPDRATPITGIPQANPNQPQGTTWRAPGVAQDFLAGLNVLSIVVEMPRIEINGGNGDDNINLWCTTSR